MPGHIKVVRLAAAAVAALALLVVGPAGAGAATTCDLSAGVLEVSMSANGDGAIVVALAGQIEVDDRGGTPLACTGGTPTTTNTNTISIHNAPGLTNNDVSVVNVGGFAPGLTPEPGDDEIETFVNLNNAPVSQLELFGRASGEHITLGALGININATPAEDQPDRDINFSGDVSVRGFFGGLGSDVVGAQGGQGTGGPVAQGLLLAGGGSDDVVGGGTGADTIDGGSGIDSLAGGAGNDSLEDQDGGGAMSGGGGDDTLEPTSLSTSVDGGDGQDLLTYNELTVGVDVGLNGTGAERLEGTRHADILRGDAGPNQILGGDDGDRIDGGGGSDEVNGGRGDDSIAARDGIPDTVICGDGTDDVTTDANGVDLLAFCETTIFPPPPDTTPGPPPPGPGDGGGGGVGGGPPVPVPVPVPTVAFGAQTQVTLTLASSRIPAEGPVAVRVSNANAFPVGGALSGETTGRVGKRRVKLASRTFVVAARSRTTVRLRLPAALRRELARKRRLSLRLTATVRDPAANSRTVRKVLKPRLRRR